MFICMLREIFPIFDDGWCSLGSASSIQCVGSLLVTTVYWIFRRKWFRWVNWLSRKTVWHCWYYRPPLRCAGMRWHLLVWPVHGQCGPSLPESLHRHLSEVESRSNQSLATWHWHPDSYTPIGSKYYIKNFTIKVSTGAWYLLLSYLQYSADFCVMVLRSYLKRMKNYLRDRDYCGTQ